MKMKSHNLCAIVNVSMVLIFAMLAVRLDKWWIVLFAVLFMHHSEQTIKKEEK